MDNTQLSDEALVEQSLQGSKAHLQTLIGRYNDYIFSICYKMLWQVEDARDLTQEILITVITRLSSFQSHSSFKTWLYRIAVNHTLNYIKASNRRRTFSFDKYGENLDRTPDHELPSNAYGVDNEILFEETKQTCMSGMLLCLDEHARMVFIIGEIFGFSDKIGSAILDISPENFRTQLSRARKDLYQFMNDKCGLVNKKNPCRCAKKTRSFIEAGYVNPDNLLFYPRHRSFIEQSAPDRQHELEDKVFSEYQELYQRHTVLSDAAFIAELDKLLTSPTIRSLFNFR